MKFRTTCPQCGEVEVGYDDVVVSIGDPDDVSTGSLAGGFGFVCEGCARGVWKGADARIIDLLIGLGLEPVQDAAARILEDAARGA